MNADPAPVAEAAPTIWSRFTEALSEMLVPPLKALQSPIDEFFNSLPLWVGQAAVIALLLAAMIWAVTRSRAYVYLGAPDQAGWRDLRWWTVILLTPYILIYLFLG